MKTLSKKLAIAGLALSALSASPAAAQVAGGIATVDTPGAIIGTNALRTAYESVNTTYQTQLTTTQTKRQELSELLKPFDTNGNQSLDDAELPAVQNSPQFADIQRLETEIANLTTQVNDARIFAIEQIFAQYGAALEEVATQQQVQMVMPLNTVLYAKQDADITAQISAALNTKVPSVGVVPPSDWRRSQQGANLFQEIQQRLIMARLRQQQAAQAQQGTGQPAANTQAPQGR